MNNEIKNIQTEEEIVDISNKKLGIAIANEWIYGLVEGMGFGFRVI